MPIQDTRIQDAVPVEAVPVEAVPAEVAAPALAVTAPARQAERRAATPLGVPEGPPAEVGAGFPVAPLLRDRLDLDGR
jgi:hypothetical protein